MKIRNSSLQKQKMAGIFQHRSQVENKGNVATLTDLIHFLKTCTYFKKLINEYEDIEVKGLDIIKGKILVDEKTKFAKEHPELPGLEQVEKYLKFVTLPNEDGSESIITVDEKYNEAIDGKPLIGIDIHQWVADHGGLGDRSTHSKNILYVTKNDGLKISRAQHTRAGLLENQVELPKYILEAGLENALVGSFFINPDGQINVRGSNFSDLNLNYSNFNKALAEDTSWINTRIRHADLSYSVFKGADISYADFSYADLIEAKIYSNAYKNTKALGTIFSFADMRGAGLNKLDARNAKFISTNAQGIQLQGANLANADFSHADLTKATLYTSENHKTNLDGANFSFTNLSEASISGIDCTNVNFTHAIIRKLSFVDIVSLEGSSFVGADFSESQFFLSKNLNKDHHHQSKFANLNHTNFSNANLSNAQLHSVDLTGAKLNDAILNKTQLIYVNLINADLSGVDFENASFHQVKITATQLAKAKNVDKIRYFKSSAEEKLSYQQLCELEETKLLPDQVFTRNLITNALTIQNQQKINQLADTTQNEIVATMEVASKEEEQTTEVQPKKAKKRKKKDKVEEKQKAESTQTSTNQQAIVRHGFFNNDTLNKYQCILKGIGALTVALGCLWVLNALTNQTDEYANINIFKL